MLHSTVMFALNSVTDFSNKIIMFEIKLWIVQIFTKVGIDMTI